MKTLRTAVLTLLCSISLLAQHTATNNSSPLTPGIYGQPNEDEFSLSPGSVAAPTLSMLRDTVRYNMYGDLRNDDLEYNPRSPLWLCAVRVGMNNAVTWAFDRYFFNADYARVGVSSWKRNLSTTPEWDTDRFGMNYFLHPYSGAGYFNAARSNGYDFYESIPFAFGGSVMWEYFGENTLPAVNDLINTTVTGAFLGEISYRLSSDFLDDRTTGAERVFRELFAGVINPSRAFSRLLQGKMFRLTSEEVYQKEPLNMTFSAGTHMVNDGRDFWTGPSYGMLVLRLEYGNPFEQRSRKIFDYFRLRADLVSGPGRKIIDNIVGQALLFGKNVQSGNLEMLIGGFQHYDFWDNTTFEISTIGFGAGVVSKLAVGENSNLFFDFHLGIVPLGGNSTLLGPDTSQFRDYNYGGGAEAKLESSMEIGRWGSIVVRGNYYWIHTYIGIAGDNLVGILRPSATVRLFKNLSIGFEHLVYYSDRSASGFSNVVDVRTEQKIFIQLRIENFQHEK